MSGNVVYSPTRTTLMHRIPTTLKFIPTLLVGLSLMLGACAGAAPTEAPTAPAATTSPLNASPTTAPAVEPTQGQTEATATLEPPVPTVTPAADGSEGQLRLSLAADGNLARFLVTEQLAGFDLPNDAVGETSAITGQIVLAADGTVNSAESKFVVDLTSLKSDSSMRDGFIQRNTLQTSTSPNAEFVVTSVTGLSSPLPTSGAVTFQLGGEMTVHGVTRTTTWDVVAEIVGQELVGTARTNFTFGDFGLSIPQVARVLSIEDNIRLEYDFRLVVQP
jgi:polyisoprenoid-binding protein YceI